MRWCPMTDAPGQDALKDRPASSVDTESDSLLRPTVVTVTFLVLFLLGAVPTIVSVAWGRYQQQEMTREILQRDLQVFAHGISMVGSEYLQDRRRMLTLVKISVERQPDWTAQTLQPLFEEEATAARSLSALHLTDRSGASIVDSTGDWTALGGDAPAAVSHAESAYFQEFKETGTIAWSGVEPSHLAGRSEVRVALPVRSETTGEEGVLIGGIDVDGLASMFDGIKENVELRYVVVDHMGGILMDSALRADDGALSALKHVFPSTCPQSIEAMPDPSGRYRFAACSQMAVGSHLWAAWALAPEMRSAAQAQAQLRFGMVLGLGLLIVILTAGGLAVRVRHYFSKLNRTVQKLGEGDFDVEIPPSSAATPRELRHFREVGAQMVDRLQRNQETTRRLLGELEDANRQLRPLASAWTQIGEAVEVLDADGKILFANPACVEMLGEAATRPGSRSTIWADDRAARISECFARKRRWTGEVDVQGTNGRRIQAVTVTPVFEDDHLARVVVIRWDLTDLRTAESVAARSERLASLGTLAAGLAHEINNPLTYVLMNLETLRSAMEEAEKHDLHEAARESLAGVGLIQHVVQEMLLLARDGNQTDQGESRQKVSVRKLLDSSVMMAQARFLGQVQTTVSVEGSPTIWVRKAELTQVMVNLVVNAGLAYLGLPGVVEVEAGIDPEDPDHVRMMVRDAGTGMTPEELRQAFDPFFTTREVGKGTGLGLSVARSIVDAHAGSLTAQSAKGVGSVFTVRLPAAPDDLTSTPRAAPVPMPEQEVARKLRVLVVDDDQRVAQVISRRLCAHDVTVAIGGLDALEMLETQEFDAVLSDVMMPDLDGPSLFAELSERWPSLQARFAFVTGAPRDSAVARAVKQTGRPVFHKPVAAGLLVKWIDSLEFD